MLHRILYVYIIHTHTHTHTRTHTHARAHTNLLRMCTRLCHHVTHTHTHTHIHTHTRLCHHVHTHTHTHTHTHQTVSSCRPSSGRTCGGRNEKRRGKKIRKRGISYLCHIKFIIYTYYTDSQETCLCVRVSA